MATQIGPLVDAGMCDLGRVFIFHRTSPDGETWVIKAGNHTIGTYDTEARANDVACVLCGGDRLAEVAPAPEPAPKMDAYVAAVQKKVSKN